MQIQKTNDQPAFGSLGSNLSRFIETARTAGWLTPEISRTCEKLRNDGCLVFDFTPGNNILTVSDAGSRNVAGKKLPNGTLSNVLRVATEFLDSFTERRQAMFGTYTRTAVEKGKLREALAKLDLENEQAAENVRALFVNT